MYDKEDALKIKELVEAAGSYIWKRELNYLEKEEIVILFYSTREIKEKHEEKMKKRGWTIVDYKSKQRLYSSFYDEEKVYVWTGCFAKLINK